MNLKRGNRAKRTITPRNPDALGNPRRIVVWHDDLKKSKKPPAWMKELLFTDDAA